MTTNPYQNITVTRREDAVEVAWYQSLWRRKQWCFIHGGYKMVGHILEDVGSIEELKTQYYDYVEYQTGDGAEYWPQEAKAALREQTDALVDEYLDNQKGEDNDHET